MYLESERMVLRDFNMGDLADLHEILGDEEVMLNTEPAYDRQKTQDFLRAFCIERTPKGAYAAALKSTGKVIGYVLFKPVDEPEIYEIGWIFNKHFWRRGYAYEICKRLIAHGFEGMQLHKICAEAIDENKSVSLMKKLGMTEEGIQRKHTRTNNGEWADLYWYAILKEDYFRPHR
jgi:Acetyltransferases, including N-acetylases of ribosomal proteins